VVAVVAILVVAVGADRPVLICNVSGGSLLVVAAVAVAAQPGALVAPAVVAVVAVAESA